METEAMQPLDSEEVSMEKSSTQLNLWLVLLLGMLLGFGIKTEAARRFTVGFNDYKLPSADGRYDMNQLDRQVLEKYRQQIEAQNAESAAQDSLGTQDALDTQNAQ